MVVGFVGLKFWIVDLEFVWMRLIFVLGLVVGLMVGVFGVIMVFVGVSGVERSVVVMVVMISCFVYVW